MPAKRKLIGAAAVALIAIAASAQAAEHYGFGRTPTAGEIAAWNIDVRADGRGLPQGHGSVGEGAVLFAEKCAGCHGEKGERLASPIEPLVGGIGTLASAKPLKTVGSYWPYPTTLYDFIRRAMPFNAPQSLSDNEVYALTAYVLSLNGIVGTDTVFDAASLPKLRMPNRDGFAVHDWRGTKATE